MNVIAVGLAIANNSFQVDVMHAGKNIFINVVDDRSYMLLSNKSICDKYDRKNNNIRRKQIYSR